MQNQVLGQDAAPTASCLLPTLRAQLTALTFHSPHLSEAEKLRANHHIHECEDSKRLTHWLRTVKADLARRDLAAQTKKALAQRPLPYLRNWRQPQLLRRAAKLTANMLAFHYVVDRPALARDCRAVAQFQPARTLTYAQLLRR
ncbi:MAG: hypothetical protein ACRYFV_24515 [Janthinobacterium lividum]